jgi:hypothetical protein
VRSLYDMDVINENEGEPNYLATDAEFFLPDGDFSELIRLKEVCVVFIH